MIKLTVRVRFAPSPTGQIHIGNIRTAVFNWLYARNKKGTFILRIEDTDLERSSEEFETLIYQELSWLDLDVDEGAKIGGPFGPYRQMERTNYYQKYAQQLVETHQAYLCFCSTSPQKDDSFETGYSGVCRNLSRAEISAKKEQKQPYAIRLKNDCKSLIGFEDLIRGLIEFEAQQLDDMVLMKKDGSPTYNFACVIDDYLMKITHVLRGEDHISNTPKQLLLYQAFNWTPPLFGHLPLILDQNRQRLKKRSQDAEVFIGRYRELGYLSEAVFNYLVLLGWSDGSDEEVMDKEKIITAFSLERINPAGAIFDLEKLKWLNGIYIRKLSSLDLRERVQPFLSKQVLDLPQKQQEYLIDALKKRAETLVELGEMATTYTAELTFVDQEETKKVFKDPQVKAVLTLLQEKIATEEDLTPENSKKLLKTVMKELKVKGALVFKPVRYALTGRGTGPDLDEAMAFLGATECRKRLQQSIDFIGRL